MVVDDGWVVIAGAAAMLTVAVVELAITPLRVTLTQ